MEIISHPIPAAIVLLGILVFVHEFGHFIVGKWCGIAAETFSIGFGPTILKYKRGLTEYRLSIIPLGGYVKFYGSIRTEPVPQEARGREYFSASPFRRFLTIAAGPGANFILAVVAYSILAKSGIPYIKPEIGFVNSGGAAASAGIVAGDLIERIDGVEIRTWRDLETKISKSPDRSIRLSIRRGEESSEIDVVPKSEPGITEDGEANVGRIGIAAASVSALIAIKDVSSLAFQMGFRTGDKINEISWIDSNGGETVRPISRWIDITHALKTAKSNAAIRELSFKVSRPTDRATNLSQQEYVEFQYLLPIPVGSSAETDLLEIWGVSDGQLIVNAVDPGIQHQLQPKDLILAMNGQAVRSQFDLFKLIDTTSKPHAEFQIIRDNQAVTVQEPLIRYKKDVPSGAVDAYRAAFELIPALSSPSIHYEERNFIGALQWGMTETGTQSLFLVRILKRIFTGNISLSTMGGPILIAKVAGDAAKRGWQTFLSTMAIISINLAVVNLVPIPVLDGGQIVLILAEAVRRRPVPVSMIENYQRLGFVMVMALVVLVFYNDLNRFWSRIIEGVIGNTP
jgi:regulator of sigma E protease